MRVVNKDILIELYLNKKIPMHNIADQLGVAVGTVFNYLKLYNIQTRPSHKGMLGKSHSDNTRKIIKTKNTGKKLSEEVKQKISQSRKGLRFVQNEWGGHKKLRADGYMSVYMPDHPHANKDGYIMEHRLVMEKILGRYLESNEVVHHINSKRNDNQPENLMLFSSLSDHRKYHAYFKKRSDDLSIKYI